MITRFFKKRKRSSMVDPDEIFLDSKNLENFDRQQFEGRIEKPISKKTINLLGAFCLIIVIIFGVRLSFLQIKNGASYRERSENNILNKQNIFTERGIIYDRNKKELAWNQKVDELPDLYKRTYLSPGFAHVLGYVSYPTQDSKGYYWQDEFEGKDGLGKEKNQDVKSEK